MLCTKRSGETSLAICLCPPPFTHLQQRNFSTSRRAVGHGSCTPKVVAFLKKTRGSIVRGQKLDYTEGEMVPLTFFTYQTVIVDEIVGRGASKFVICGDRIFIKCPIGRCLATQGYDFLEIRLSRFFLRAKLSGGTRTPSVIFGSFSVVYGKYRDEYDQSRGKDLSSCLRYLATSIINRFISIILDCDVWHSSIFSISLRSDTFLH